MPFRKNIYPLLVFILSYSSSVIGQEPNTGNLLININIPDSFYIVDGNDLINAQKVESGQVLNLDIGVYHFTIVSGYTDDFPISVRIESGATTTLSHTFNVFRINHYSSLAQIENQQNLIINTDPDSEIYLNGNQVGKHRVELLVNPGFYSIKTIHPLYGSLKENVEVSFTETELFSRYNEHQIRNAPIKSLLPGVGYLINDQKDLAILTYFTMGYLAGSYFSIDRKIRDQSAINDVQRLENQQTASLIGLGVVYLFTTIHSKRKPSNGYPQKKSIFGLSNVYINNTIIPTTGFKIGF